jgi:hypothetical protein
LKLKKSKKEQAAFSYFLRLDGGFGQSGAHEIMREAQAARGSITQQEETLMKRFLGSLSRGVMRLFVMLATAVLLAAGSQPGWAAQVRYEYSSRLRSPSGGFVTGYVTFDASLWVPGFISVFDFSDWAFAWGSDFTYGPATHSFDPEFGAPVGLVLEPDLSVGYTDFCVSRDGVCFTRATSHPVLGVSGFTPGTIETFATTSPNSVVTECCSGGWSKATVIVNIDFPHTINLRSKGVVPVAILSSPGFNVVDVAVNSVTFAGALPERFVYEDVNSDGVSDLVFYFPTQELHLNTSTTEATLTGELTDGVPIIGSDSVRVMPSK